MVTLPGGEQLSSLGLGTWRMGESSARRAADVAALRKAIELGYRVIDTAEMYGEGGAEKIVGLAVAEALRAGDVRRDELFVVSKVYPKNAGSAAAVAACERSLGRLGLDHLDAYLLHWRGNVPLQETVAAFEGLRTRGRIRHWGVSNFDRDDMAELFAAADGGRCAINQIYYSVSRRGAGFDLLPWHAVHGVATMAYSPIDQGALASSRPLREVARRNGATPAQIALAWLVRQPGVQAIPKASSEAHLRENLDAASVNLTEADLAAIDAAFPPPAGKSPLAML